jgi:integrase
MPRRTLTDKGIAALKAKAKFYHFPDPELSGHYIRVMPTGFKAYAVITRDPFGKQVGVTIGDASLIGVNVARDKAREAINRIKAGTAASPDSFRAVSENWFKRHVEAKGHRSAKETRRYLDKWILPAWGEREFTSIRRRDVAALLDHVEDKGGPVAADNALKRVSAICSWFQSRHDDYVSPVVKGMRRSSTQERARERILSDDEIRAVWKAAEANGRFGGIVRLLLLTAQRRDKVASMRWEDISIDGTWTIPTAKNEKGNAQQLALPPMALDIIKAQPRFASNPYIFAGRGKSYLTGYSKAKKSLALGLPQWGLHDLRRTARSLMARAGVRPDVAERVLGHKIGGVEGIYNRHEYQQEKAHALKALAGLIETILNPKSNIVALRSL